jgi:hypothetical protein
MQYEGGAIEISYRWKTATEVCGYTGTPYGDWHTAPWNAGLLVDESPRHANRGQTP